MIVIILGGTVTTAEKNPGNGITELSPEAKNYSLRYFYT
jgi:hypothetical protein